MVISQTPFRISFFGGGTDFPQWYRAHGGGVLSTTINKYVRITSPSNGGEFLSDWDLPVGSGLGSSSSLTVGVLNVLHTLRGEAKSARELADLALQLEQKSQTVGSQDQIAAAFGGFNRIDFHRDGKYTVTALSLPSSRLALLNSRLLLFFTGSSRIASEIEKSKCENLTANFSALSRLHAMVSEGESLLQNDAGLDDFGRLLHDGWRIKRSLSPKVSNPHIDAIYETGLQNGALGGKILGAGGGGFILFYVPLANQARVKLALGTLQHVDFKFESAGTRIVTPPTLRSDVQFARSRPT